LFNRFVRLPRDLASTTAGNGLGLYLCRALVTAMNGKIWAESTGVSGEGTTFHVRLPWYREHVGKQAIAQS
jgi:signal transduction histidine kinase